MAKTNKVERTAQQKGALREAYKLLEAQFDDLLIVCGTRDDHDYTAVSTDLDVYWKGSCWVVMGMADLAKRRLEYSHRNKLIPH